MSVKSRRFLAGLFGAILLIFVIAAVAIVAFRAGQNSAKMAMESPPTVILSTDGSSVTIEESGVEPESVFPPAQDDGQSGTQQEPADSSPTGEAQTADDTTQPTHGEGATTKATVQPAEQQGEGEEEIRPGPRVPVGLDEEDVDLILEAWAIIDEEFDGPLPDRADVTYSAIAGSLELLRDDYTRFINPELAERNREQLNGSFEGIGAFVNMTDDGYLVIVRPMEGLPADRAGIKANDVVTHVDGESVLGMSLEEITATIKGPDGTEVTLTIRRETLEEPFDVIVKREKIVIPFVVGEMLDDNIAYVRLSGFSANASQQLEETLVELLDQDPQGLIFDLRDNPGGYLSQAVDVADLFLGDGILLYERDSRGFEEVFESEDGDLAEEIKLVILVNAGSASASEIVAGAVQDRDRGTLVGETTFGKGSVQQPHTLSDGSELRVTIARWYTPDNRSIAEGGIAPDIAVASPEEFGTENDTQLQRAIQFILDGR